MDHFVEAENILNKASQGYLDVMSQLGASNDTEAVRIALHILQCMLSLAHIHALLAAVPNRTAE